MPSPSQRPRERDRTGSEEMIGAGYGSPSRHTRPRAPVVGVGVGALVGVLEEPRLAAPVGGRQLGEVDLAVVDVALLAGHVGVVVVVRWSWSCSPPWPPCRLAASRALAIATREWSVPWPCWT